MQSAACLFVFLCPICYSCDICVCWRQNQGPNYVFLRIDSRLAEGKLCLSQFPLSFDYLNLLFLRYLRFFLTAICFVPDLNWSSVLVFRFFAIYCQPRALLAFVAFYFYSLGQFVFPAIFRFLLTAICCCTQNRCTFEKTFPFLFFTFFFYYKNT